MSYQIREQRLQYGNVSTALQVYRPYISVIAGQNVTHSIPFKSSGKALSIGMEIVGQARTGIVNSDANAYNQLTIQENVFSYEPSSHLIEHVYSENVDSSMMANIANDLASELLRDWDIQGYKTITQNSSNIVKLSNGTKNDINSIIEQVTKIKRNIKDNLNSTVINGALVVGLSPSVWEFLDKVSSAVQSVTNRTLLEQSHSDVTFVEIPNLLFTSIKVDAGITSDHYMEGYFRPNIVLHGSTVPSVLREGEIDSLYQKYIHWGYQAPAIQVLKKSVVQVELV